MFNTLRKFFVDIYIILIYFDSVLHFAFANLCIYTVLIYFIFYIKSDYLSP